MPSAIKIVARISLISNLTTIYFFHQFITPHFKSFRIPCLGEADDMSRPGDWNCRSCNHLNFQRRDSCQKCGDPRQGGGVTDYSAIFGGVRMTGSSPFGFTTGPDVRPGDWYCNVRDCGAHNFASRSSCFKCGALKDELTGGERDNDFSRGRGLIGNSGCGGGRSGWKSGDWICSRDILDEDEELNSTGRMKIIQKMEIRKENAPWNPLCSFEFL